MYCGDISFADKVAFNIKMDDVKQRILEDLEKNFHFKVIQKHYEKYTENLIPKLNSNPHLVAVRTNGNPYLLYLTRFNFVNHCIFIDKKVQSGYFLPRAVLTSFRFHDELFDGTLFDGEMVKDVDGNWIYIISDIIGHKSVYLENINLVRRLNIVYNILDKQYTRDEFDVCRFQVKKYFKYDQLDDMINEFIPKLKYTCRGLYFKPLFLKFRDILLNFDDSLIQRVMRKKYKSISNFLTIEDAVKLVQHDNRQIKDAIQPLASTNERKVSTKVFHVRKTANPDVYELHDGGDVHIACVPSLKTSKMLRGVFQDKNVQDRVAMECEFSDKFQKWMPNRCI
jgi:hypothetical protein